MPTLELSEDLLDVGLAVGLMRLPTPTSDPADAELNDDFFNRPDHYLSGVFTQRTQREAVLRIAGRLVDPDGSPLVGQDDEQWIPLATVAPSGQVTCGLFLIATPVEDDLLLSLGGRLERTDQVTLQLAARIPLFVVSESGADFAPGRATLGDLRVDATAILGDIGPLSVERITAGVTIPTDGAVPAAVVRLVRPPEGDPGDIILTTTDPVGAQAADVLSQLVTALAEEADPAVAAPLLHLLALIGLRAGSAVPALPLDQVIADGRDAVWSWMYGLFSSTSAANAWIGELAGLLDTTVEGTGSTAAPWKLCFAAGPAVTCLELSVTPAAGSLVVVPALRVGVVAPPALGVEGSAELVGRLVRLVLGPSPAAEFEPDLSATVTVGTIAGLSTLVSTPLPGIAGTVSVGALRTGLAVDAEGARLVLEAHRVAFPAVPVFAVLDLTDTDALLDAGGALLDGALDTLLTALGDSAAARTVFVLLGLRRPTGTDAVSWPYEITPAALFSDPIDAVRDFHLAVLAGGDAPRLVDELGALLRQAGGAAGVTGSGAAESPWAVAIAAGSAGRADLLAWTSSGDDGTRLHLGSRLSLPGTPVGTATIGLAVSAELVSLRLAGVGGVPADLDPQPLPGLAVSAELGEDLQLDVGPLLVLVHTVSAGVTWSPAAGMAPRLLATGAELALDGATAPLPLPVWDPDRRTFAFDGEVPWPIVERLASQLLESMANEAAQILPGLLGWRSTGARGLPAVPPPLNRPSLAGSVISLQDLVRDPWRTLGRSLVALLTGPQGREWAAELLGWVGTLTQGMSDAVQLTGSGSTGDPWAVPLTGAGRAIELVASVGDDGGALGTAALRLMPPQLQGVVDLDDASGVTVQVLVDALVALALLDPPTAEALRRSIDPTVSLAALRTALVGTDGLVPAAAQHGVGSAAATLNGSDQLALPAQFADAQLAPGAPTAPGRIFVRLALPGIRPWPGETAARTIDLTAPGLPAEAFNLTALPTSGPWFVLLPTRLGTGAVDPATGHQEQVARLRHVVDRLRSSRAAGSPLALIAHGPAGHVARATAADAAAGVTHLTLLGTSIATAPTAWADDPAAGDGLRLVQALRELAAAQPGDLAEADQLLALLDGVTDGPPAAPGGAADAVPPYPLGDVPPPLGLPALPGTVAVRTVAANLDADSVDLALGRLVAEVLRARTAGSAGGDELRLGVRARPVSVTASGIRTEVALHLDAVTLPLDFGDDSLAVPPTAALHPRLRLSLRLDRPGGWLVGGPTGSVSARRDPRLRALHADLSVDLVDGSAQCALMLFDAAAFGVRRGRWPISLSPSATSGLPAHLAQEDRLLLGELATALGSRPAAGPLTAFMDALAALGLATVDAGGHLGFEVDPLEQLLLDARSALAALAANPAPVATALGALTGGTATGTVASVPLGGAGTVAVDLGPARSLTLATTTGGITVAGGVGIDGSVTVRADGHLAVALTIGLGAGGGPNGRLGLTLGVDSALSSPVSAALTRTGGADGLVRSVPLLPSADLAALERLATAMVPGELMRLALEFAVREVAAFGPLLDAVGLRDPATGRVRIPAGLMADPGRWLTTTATLGASTGRPDPARVQALLTAVRAFLPGPHPAGGVTLAWGVQVLSAETAGTLRMTLRCPAVTLGALRVAGEAGVAIGPTGTVAPVFSVTVDLLDPAAPASILGGLDAGLGSDAGGSAVPTVTARLPVAGAVLELPILPISGGLGDLVTAAVTRALPLALDALTRVGTFGGFNVGAAIAALADALDLRTASPSPAFAFSALEALAADPVGQLTSRLSIGANRSDLAVALRLLADPLLPGTAGGAGAVVELVLDPRLTVTIDLSGSVPAVRATASGLSPIPELTLGGTFGVGAGGVRAVAVTADIADPGLLEIASVSLLPGVAFRFGVDTASPAGAFEVALWTAAPARAQREALVVLVDLATGPAIRWRTGGAAPTDLNDPLLAAFGLARAYLIPLAAGLVLEVDEVRAALEVNVTSTSSKLGQLMHPHVLQRTTPGGQPRYRLALFDTAPDGSFDLDLLLRRVALAAAQAANALLGNAAGGGLPLGDLPLAVRIASDNVGGATLFGVGLDIPSDRQFVLFDAGDARLSLEVVEDWLDDFTGTGTGRGLELFALRVPAAGQPSISPRIVIRGLGVRIDKAGGSKLVDLGVTIRSIGVHGYLDKDLATPAVRFGGHLELDQFGIPLGDASGNPVASNFMQPSSDAGDDDTLAPAFSPALSIVSEAAGPGVDLVVRAGPGDGPWWLPIQRAFGPLYVEQVGLGIERDTNRDPVSVSILVDGGASLAGLVVQVDDLEVIIPWDTPFDLTAWRLDLAGIGVGYSGSGLTVAGGLRKLDRGGVPDYLGMLSVTFNPYGLTAVGGYGVFPDGAGGDYVSFFAFGAVTAPIGGPPAFFVTGLGGGMGVNRRLIAPTIEQVASYILVQALDPFSSLAQNPMGALDQLGTVFPPERGAIWFAAGVSFTSFSLVYGTVVLTVEVHDGLEINILGLAQMALPNPAFPIAQIELALQARLSTSEGIFSVQAQLTENSWLINESCRLTGGFAFVIWFKGELAGQFVLSLGGYHPNFDKPAAFPAVPRLGFAWEPGFGVSIKGGAYFALTSTCVMAGGSLEASYKSSVIWASLEAGVDILVSWDPFFYDFRAYIRISAGIDIEVCFFVCGHVRMSFSFSAELHILGPKLRGSVYLDLDLTSVTVRFGPTGSTNSSNPLSFAAFRDKYLRSGDDGGHVLAASITAGQVPPTASQTGSGSGADGDADDGTAARPWKVGPEFSFFVQTRAATNAVPGVGVPTPITSRDLDLGPALRTDITSSLIVSVIGAADVTAEFTRTVSIGNVPEATWTVLPPTPQPEANVIATVVGLSLQAKVDIATDTVTVEIERVEISADVKPLPFGVEAAQTGSGRLLGRLRERSAAATTLLGGSADTFVTLAVLSRSSNGDDRLRLAAQRADRVSPPRLVALPTGIADTQRKAIATTPVKHPDPVVEAVDPDPGEPRLAAWLRTGMPVATATAGPTFSTATAGARVPAPTLAAVTAEVAAPLGAWLRFGGAPTAKAAARAATVLPTAGLPRTDAAGLRRERIRSLRGDRAFAKSAAALDARLTDGKAAVRGGDALVWTLPNSRRDRAKRRPRLALAGIGGRMVFLDRAGEVLDDRSVAARPLAGSVPRGGAAVPQGTERIALLAGADTGGRYAGWLADAALVQVGTRTYLGANCSVVTGTPATRRRHADVTTAVVRARDAVSEATLTRTHLPAGTLTVVIVLDGSADEPPQVTIGGAATRSVPPRLVQLGERTALLLALEGSADEPVSVTVADDRPVAGVVGSTDDVDEVARQVAVAGLAAFGALRAADPAGAGTLRWESE